MENKLTAIEAHIEALLARAEQEQEDIKKQSDQSASSEKPKDRSC